MKKLIKRLIIIILPFILDVVVDEIKKMLDDFKHENKEPEPFP